MPKNRFNEIKDLNRLKEVMADAGVVRLYLKKLSPNDNSKNQIYLGSGFEALNIIPNEGVYVDDDPKGSKRNRFKADVNLQWVDSTGNFFPAPNAQLILYPKYPEVRMSGLLKGCSNSPSQLMHSRQEGRLLFLGITNNRGIIAHLTGPENPLRNQINQYSNLESQGVFFKIPLKSSGFDDTRRSLILALKEIHNAGWIDSIRLCQDGTTAPCKASNCGGYTLEARLGIRPNSYSNPDYLGWELKQHGVSSFSRPHSGSPVTLMTPEPTAGIYKDKGVEYFIRKFGYPDKTGRKNRLNFGGIYRFGGNTPSTGLNLHLEGYDFEAGKIVNVHGGISLVSPKGEEAATWLFADLMSHWNRKHAQAAYVPSICRKEPHRQYSYGNIIEMGKGTDFLKFLNALAGGLIYYDPGIKLENASGPATKIKRRSQFRIKPSNLECLYETMESVNLLIEPT